MKRLQTPSKAQNGQNDQNKGNLPAQKDKISKSKQQVGKKRPKSDSKQTKSDLKTAQRSSKRSKTTKQTQKTPKTLRVYNKCVRRRPKNVYFLQQVSLKTRVKKCGFDPSKCNPPLAQKNALFHSAKRFFRSFLSFF